MDRIEINGGRPLTGEVRVSGAKNAALPMLAAALLADGECEFENVPDLMDVGTMAGLLNHLGAKTEITDHRAVVDASGLNNPEAPYDLVRKMRASVLVLGPLAARLKRVRVSLPGGCAIGARPIDLHLKGLAAMGAKVNLDHGYVDVVAEKLTGADLFMDIATVTGTENLMMAAALAKGKTTIRNAAREPEISALADLLNSMGGRVTGAGTPEITIEGVKKLKPARAKILPDRIEAGTFLVAGAATGGDVTVTNMNPQDLAAVLEKLAETGAKLNVFTDAVRVRGPKKIQSVDVKTLPYPGFPTDMQAQFMVLLSTAKGLSVITETIFENRFIHVQELTRLGADIEITRNTAVVKGVKKLLAAPVMATDLRASASLVIAGLIAQGTTTVNRVYHLDRGYESLESKLASLGAAIRRVK